MKIEHFFQPKAKAAAAEKPGSNKQLVAEGGTSNGAAEGPDVKDTLPNSDRDVDKAGGSGGPLSECTNKRASSGQLTAPAAKKQQVQQDVQQIDLCDDDDDDNTAAAAAAQGAGDPTAQAHEGPQQQDQAQATKQQEQDRQDQQQGQQQDQQQQQQQREREAAMDVDQEPLVMSTPAPSSNTGSPAGTPAPSAAAAAAAEKEPATPADALVPAAIDAAAAPSALKSTGGKAAAEVLLTPEQRKQLLEDCQKELPLLEAELDVRPDLSGHLEADKKPLDLKHKVSLLAEGQSLPLTELSEVISRTLSKSSNSSHTKQTAEAGVEPSSTPAGTPESAPPPADSAAAAAGSAQEAAAGEEEDASGPSALVVRNLIQEVASRKSYGLQDGALANVDALEDATAAFHWCWELRTFTGLPKAVKQHADAARKHRKQVLDRLKAASAYVQLAQSMTKVTKTAESKLARAAAKLGKVPALQTLQAHLQAAVEAAEQHCSTVKAKQAVSRLDKASKEEQAAQAKAEKARQAEAERAAKEAAKAAEAAEKARIKAEKDAEREAKRQQKAAEAAKKAAEAERKAAEAAKKKEKAEAAKAGFGSTTGLHKAQNVFKTFFGLPSQRPPTPSGGDASQGQGSQMDGGSHHKEQSKEAARLWTPVAGPTQQQVCDSEALEQQLPYFSGSGDTTAGGHSLLQLLTTAKQHWRAVRKRRKRVWGMPPSWAQRPGVSQDPDHVEHAAAALYGEGVDIKRLRCWRRKLIKHNDSVRPPFYGSVQRTRSAYVSGRRPFGKDVELDYEEMSDQDWEEEPEGESLSADEDGDDEGLDEADEDEEGFVVGDGYLSDDEGMRDEEEPLGCTGSQLAAAAAAAGAGPAGAASNDSSATALAHLEAVLDHARSKGRHVLLVNNCSEMQWEPTTQLPPAILSCLRAQVMRTDITCAPPTAADLPHIFGATAAAAAAAAAAGSSNLAPAAAAAVGGSSPDAAAGAEGTPGGAGGGRGRPATVFPDALLPALVQLVHNSTLNMDQLVKQFVESQAAVGVKVAKARVRDKIKEISNMRMVAKAPLYTVKPEVLQALQEGGAPAAGAGDAAGAAACADTRAADMQVYEPAAAAAAAAAPPPAGSRPEQQPEVTVAAAPADAAGTQSTTAAAAAAVAGLKRPASADPEQQQQQQQPDAQQPASNFEQQQGAASCPPAKKAKHTPAGGIERFFSAAKAAKQPAQTPGGADAANQQAQQQGVQQLEQQPQQPAQQQQEPQQGTPPSTPKHKLAGVPSLHHSELRDAVAAAGSSVEAAAAGDSGGGGGGAGVDRSGALPMLTPPSDAAAEDRPSKGRHSPVPFRLNSLHAAQDAAPAAAAAAADEDAGAPADPEQQQQQQPQPQPGRQNIAHMFRRQQQQQDRAGNGPRQAGSSQGGLLGGSSSHLSPAAAAAANGVHKPSRLGGAASGNSSIGPPQLPEVGSAPGSAFWKQLAQWVVAVREPSAADIDAAFKVFDQNHLTEAVRSMPQMMLSAMVKTLGSSTQSMRMRSACARCISNTVHSLVYNEQRQQQLQQDGGRSPAPHHQGTPGAAARTPSAAPAGAFHNGRSPSPLRSDLAAASSASPSPSASPRSAPMAASFEELCAEPKLLDNLLLCLNPEKCVEAAKNARVEAAAPPLGPGAAEEAEELSRNAVRAVSVMLLVGVAPPRAAGRGAVNLQECSRVTAAAAEQLRSRVGCVANWRGGLRAHGIRSDDTHRVCFALMAHYAMLSDPAASNKLVPNKRLATSLLNVLAARGSKDGTWAIQKWCLVVLSALLSDDTFKQWALPWNTALQPLQLGTDEMCSTLEGIAVLLASALSRSKQGLADPGGADRDVVRRCLQLADVLMDFVVDQLQHSTNGLPPRLAQLFDEAQDEDHCSLREALQAVAEQAEWQEAARHAQQLLDVANGGSGVQQHGVDEMQE